MREQQGCNGDLGTCFEGVMAPSGPFRCLLEAGSWQKGLPQIARLAWVIPPGTVSIADVSLWETVSRIEKFRRGRADLCSLAAGWPTSAFSAKARPGEKGSL